jgi:hypothetical protein
MTEHLSGDEVRYTVSISQDHDLELYDALTRDANTAFAAAIVIDHHSSPVERTAITESSTPSATQLL